MEDACPELQRCQGGAAEKLVDLVPDAPESDAPLLRLARLAQLAGPAPDTPDVVRCGERSCAVTALADAVAQSELLASLLRKPAAVAVQWTPPSQKLELRLGLREVSQQAY
jgi:hypothetical protein